MIYLDWFPYVVDKANYSDKPTALASYGRGLTGMPLAVTSGVFAQELDITLNVHQMEYEQLKASLTKCHTTPTYLDFSDERGMWYDPLTGTDTSTHKYSTGVWFASLSEARPTEALFDPFVNNYYPGFQSPHKRFTCTVHLIIYSKILH